MKANIVWRGGASFSGEAESGHTVIMDGPADHGGQNQGPRPMEMLLLGLGGCASFDVTHILKKSRKVLSHCEVHIEAERDPGVPAVFTQIHLHFKVSGPGLNEAQVKRAVELSAEKYCSASIMLARGGVKITHGYELLDTPV